MIVHSVMEASIFYKGAYKRPDSPVYCGKVRHFKIDTNG